MFRIFKTVLNVISFVLFLLILPMWPAFYLLCRLEATPCPHCGEKWFTELTGEWGEEDWRCRRCGRTWTVPYHCG